MKEKKFKIEDALNATKAAIAEGVMPGGGAALAKVAEALADLLAEQKVELSDEEKIGVKIIQSALTSPLRQIALNAGVKDISLILNEIKDIADANSGYDFAAMKKVDMLLAGIVDPLKVTRTALENASSIANTLITMEVMVTDIPEKHEHGMAGMGGGMGMM